MQALVIMHADGRLTLPKAVRESLGISGETPFEAEVEDGTLVLRPAMVIPREDAWAYTREHRALVARALADADAGRVHTHSETDLD